MIAHRDRHLGDIVAEHVVVRDDQSIRRNDDARAQALFGAVAAEHLALVAEEVLEKRIVREG